MELETLPQGLGMLISLRELYITTKQSVMPLTEFANLKHLQVLVFHNCENMKFLFSDTLQLNSLETLSVISCRHLQSLPLFIFPKLKELIIIHCEMINLSLYNERPIQRLMIKHLYIGKFFGLQTFPSWIEGVVDTLEILQINEVISLETLPECLTTMTRLKRLHIVECPRLLSLPSDMLRLTALEYLVIDGCRELYKKYQPQSGEYFPMIAHIKNILIMYK
jgi:hypothetical protein